jgi:hypothetical protein
LLDMSITVVISALITFAVIAVAGFTARSFLRNRRAPAPQTWPSHPVDRRLTLENSFRKQPDAGLEIRREALEDLHLSQFSSAEHARYAEVQAQYAEGAGGAVTEADQSLSDVMSMSGCLVSDFEQCGADMVMHFSSPTRERVIHEIALRRKPGSAHSDEVRLTLARYRSLLITMPSGWRRLS